MDRRLSIVCPGLSALGGSLIVSGAANGRWLLVAAGVGFVVQAFTLIVVSHVRRQRYLREPQVVRLRECGRESVARACQEARNCH